MLDHDNSQEQVIHPRTTRCFVKYLTLFGLVGLYQMHPAGVACHEARGGAEVGWGGGRVSPDDWDSAW